MLKIEEIIAKSDKNFEKDINQTVGWVDNEEHSWLLNTGRKLCLF